MTQKKKNKEEGEVIRKVTRTFAVKKLVDKDISQIIRSHTERGDNLFIELILSEGFHGYNNYTNKQLKEFLWEKTGVNYEIKTK
jgi:hypothetical protein